MNSQFPISQVPSSICEFKALKSSWRQSMLRSSKIKLALTRSWNVPQKTRQILLQCLKRRSEQWRESQSTTGSPAQFSKSKTKLLQKWIVFISFWLVEKQKSFKKDQNKLFFVDESAMKFVAKLDTPTHDFSLFLLSIHSNGKIALKKYKSIIEKFQML